MSDIKDLAAELVIYNMSLQFYLQKLPTKEHKEAVKEFVEKNKTSFENHMKMCKKF